VVIHPYPLKWLSFHYGRSENFNPVSVGKIDLLGNPQPSPHGTSKDYGFSVGPDRIFTDDGNRYALFKLIHPVNKFFISMDIQMELFDFDLLAAQKTPGNLLSNNTEKDDQLPAEYLISEEHLEADDPLVEAAADNFDSSTGQLELVSSIYSFGLERMQYDGYNPSDIGAAAALAGGSGDCTEYSDLFAALCRAKGIPARVIEG
ncbi:MAG: transglutaminase-like domain-containing protein, partial [Desulfobacterales bacterium]|nr:transglutaminase-like domain-containing protein [Desulfobacterales bacterium]